ncbi:hypothetical protein HN358_02050 [Candidatus Uhrbacteria bacterium]|nr:hypothetical protein [Candidatus Uhrbacteria bacterium]MBT7716886.1 hypothetical protein [Candidatus Uhrbacteria bacterium]
MSTFLKKLVDQFPVSLVGIFASSIVILIAITLDQWVYMFYVSILALAGSYWECGLFRPTRYTVNVMRLRVITCKVLIVLYYGLMVATLALYIMFGSSIPVGIALCLGIIVYISMGIVLHFDTPTDQQ